MVTWHDLRKPDLGSEISEEDAERLEVTCGICERKIRIRSLGDHVMMEHFTIKEFIRNAHRN